MVDVRDDAEISGVGLVHVYFTLPFTSS
jgi:hypothetical protein